LEIYQERLRDLLNPGKEGDDLQLRETADEVQVPGLTVYEVTKISQVYDIMRKGASVRATGTTKMNERSSRSHSVFMLTIEQWLGCVVLLGLFGEVFGRVLIRCLVTSERRWPWAAR
jgi:hypothetical protein